MEFISTGVVATVSILAVVFLIIGLTLWLSRRVHRFIAERIAREPVPIIEALQLD